MSFRFLQTGDWQLGMTRYYFSEGAQERYSQARFDAIRTLGRIAEEQECQFVLVCGDVFDSNQVDRKTVLRALEALKEIPVTVYILPGNHDPLDAGTVYDSGIFIEKMPENVHVIRDSQPLEPVKGLELVGAPWLSKRPAANPMKEIIVELGACEVPRVMAAHGVVDLFTPDKDGPCNIFAAELEAAISAGKLSYAAVGDRHSASQICNSGQAWFAGTPEPTDATEVNSGRALVVDIDADHVQVTEVDVGKWSFIRQQIDLNSQDDVQALSDWLGGHPSKETTVLKLDLVGSISLTDNATLEAQLETARDVFATIIVEENDLVMVPDNEDFTDLRFSGYADGTVDQLREIIETGGPDADRARDALMLMLRLSRSGE